MCWSSKHMDSGGLSAWNSGGLGQSCWELNLESPGAFGERNKGYIPRTLKPAVASAAPGLILKAHGHRSPPVVALLPAPHPSPGTLPYWRFSEANLIHPGCHLLLLMEAPLSRSGCLSTRLGVLWCPVHVCTP